MHLLLTNARTRTSLYHAWSSFHLIGFDVVPLNILPEEFLGLTRDTSVKFVFKIYTYNVERQYRLYFEGVEASMIHSSNRVSIIHRKGGGCRAQNHNIDWVSYKKTKKGRPKTAAFLLFSWI